MKVPLFALFAFLILLASVALSILCVREGFVGNVSAADQALINAKFAAQETTYDRGSDNTPTSPTSSITTLIQKVKALCGYQTSACAPSADKTTATCCDGANQLCATAKATTANYKSKTPAASQSADTLTALQAKETTQCSAAKTACAVSPGGTDATCCAASKPDCTTAAVNLALAQTGSSFVKGTGGPTPVKFLKTLGDAVGKQGALSTDDSDAKAYGDMISKKLQESGNSYDVMPYDNNTMVDSIDSTNGTKQNELLQALLMSKVPATDSSLSSADVSLETDMPTGDALAQGDLCRRKRSRNGNSLPSPNPVAVQVGSPTQTDSYPFSSDDCCD
jgi:hypothetical protein